MNFLSIVIFSKNISKHITYRIELRALRYMSTAESVTGFYPSCLFEVYFASEKH